MSPGNWKTYNEYYENARKRVGEPKPPRLDDEPPLLRSRWRALLAVVIGLSLLAGLVTFASVAVMKWDEQNDPGVVACQQMADSVGSGDTKDDTSTPMTEASFIKAKKIWQHSEYPELRVAGVNVVTTIYTLDVESNKESPDVGEEMRLLRTLEDQWTALQWACAKHKVDIPALPME